MIELEFNNDDELHEQFKIHYDEIKDGYMQQIEIWKKNGYCVDYVGTNFQDNYKHVDDNYYRSRILNTNINDFQYQSYDGMHQFITFDPTSTAFELITNENIFNYFREGSGQYHTLKKAIEERKEYTIAVLLSNYALNLYTYIAYNFVTHTFECISSVPYIKCENDDNINFTKGYGLNNLVENGAIFTNWEDFIETHMQYRKGKLMQLQKTITNLHEKIVQMKEQYACELAQLMLNSQLSAGYSPTWDLDTCFKQIS